MQPSLQYHSDIILLTIQYIIYCQFVFQLSYFAVIAIIILLGCLKIQAATRKVFVVSRVKTTLQNSLYTHLCGCGQKGASPPHTKILAKRNIHTVAAYRAGNKQINMYQAQVSCALKYILWLASLLVQCRYTYQTLIFPMMLLIDLKKRSYKINLNTPAGF